MGFDDFDWKLRCEPLRLAQADPRLPPLALKVFTLLWTFAGPDGNGARPGVELLAKLLSTDEHRTWERSVRDEIKRLLELGYIVQTKAPNRRAKIATTYRVQMPKVLPTYVFLARQGGAVKEDDAEVFSAANGEFLARQNGAISAAPRRALKLITEERKEEGHSGHLESCQACGLDGFVIGNDGIPLEGPQGRPFVCGHDGTARPATREEARLLKAVPNPERGRNESA